MKKTEELKEEKKSKLSKSRKSSSKSEVVVKVEYDICDGYTKELTMEDLKNYLEAYELNAEGPKEELVDRIMVFVSHKINH